MRRDDCTIDAYQEKVIRKQADLLLRKASAYGRFPTPIDDIVAAAELEIEMELIFDEEGLGELYRALPNEQKLKTEVVKRAIGKVEGVLHVGDKTIFIDPTLHKSRQKFITLHEVGHFDMPWQKTTFKIIQDSESELDEDTRDQFEREANCFASEVWFQGDTFTAEAKAGEFGIGYPIKKLTKRYGTSCYATLRRYINVVGRSAALVVCEPLDAVNRVLTVRRTLESGEFRARFGKFTVPEQFGPESFFYRNVPVNKFRLPTPWQWQQNSRSSLCLVEAYNSTKQIFFLVYPASDNCMSLSV